MIREMKTLDDEQKQLILGENARRLLRCDPKKLR
jgi:predicted TIM-barrel fold metal-dependent hydrolase